MLQLGDERVLVKVFDSGHRLGRPAWAKALVLRTSLQGQVLGRRSEDDAPYPIGFCRGLRTSGRFRKKDVPMSQNYAGVWALLVIMRDW